MRLNRSAVAAVLSLALALGACGKSGPPASEFPAEGEPAKVKLLEAGAADKTALRWKPVKGATGGVALDLGTSFQINAAGQSMPMTMNMKMDMLATVLDVGADGSAQMESEIVSADLDMPGMGAGTDAMAMANDMLRGLSIRMNVDARGRVSGVEVTGGGAFAEQLADQMGQSLESSSIPFPEEPVGIGAKWQALSTVETNGMKVRMVAGYELVSLNGTKGEVAMTIEQYADPQKMSMAGASVELEKLKSSGGGKMQFDLATPMVVTGEMTLKMDASLEAMGQSADMRADVRMTFKPKDGLKSTHTAEPAGDDAGGGDAVAPGGGEVEAPGGVVGGEAPSDEVPAKAPAEDVPTEEPTVTP